jgi:hypothetical protein
MVRAPKFLTIGALAMGWIAVATQTASAQSHAPAAAAASAASQTNERKLPELETDRPDLTESSGVVGAGVWQLESGVLFQSDGLDRGTAHDVSAPNILLRMGIGSRLELRIGGEGFLGESLSTGTGMSSGLSDLELGFKYRLLDQDRAGVDLAVIPIVSLPVGSSVFSSGSVDPTIKLTVARDLPYGFGIGSNVIVASITEDGARFTQTAVSASLGHALGRHWNGFWELYGASALSREGGRAWLFDTGVTHAFGERLQLDLSAGRGLTHDAPDWFIGAGMAIRGFFTH